MSLESIAPVGASAGAPAPDAAPAVPPPFAAIVAGDVPALSVPPVHKDTPPNPVQSFVISNLDTLAKAGLDYYEASNSTTVLFNPAKITEKELHEADKAGKLDAVAPVAALPAAPDAPAPDAAAAAPAAPLAAVAAPAQPPVPAGVGRTRLANVTPPGPGIRPNPVPNLLSKRAV